MIKPNGPYRVEPADGIELYGADGSKFDLTGSREFLYAAAADR